MSLAKIVDACIVSHEDAVNGSDVLVYVVAILHAEHRPAERMFVEFVLQAAIVAHKHTATLLEIVEHKICLARLQHRADKTLIPIAEKFGTVENRNLHREASQRVQIGIDRFLVVGNEIII